MSDGKSPAYHGPGGIGRWVWWYVLAMLIATAVFGLFVALQ